MARAVRSSGAKPRARKGAASRARIEAELAALRAEIASALAEVPKAEDFQPLADHLYAFAESTPRLIASLEAVRGAVGPLETAARSLAEVAETLIATHESWSESLLKLPRAEDYEPLAAPLREFARVAPALAETLGSVVRAVTPLSDLVARLGETADKLRAQPIASAPAPVAQGSVASALAGAADGLAAAHEAIRSALDSLPQEPAYAKFAAQLKELATVSPSLMEWLRQVPELTVPLGDAVNGLAQAAEDLEAAEQAAREALATKPAGAR